LKAQYQLYKAEIDEAISRVLQSCQFIQGKEVADLEEALAQYVGVNYCISCANGTDALLLALMALECKSGDEVITTPFTFVATAEVVRLLNMVPVFADIDPVTYNIDAGRIAERITNRTRAIMPVSLYGQVADMDRINEVAEAKGVAVIEDGAQSFGALYRGKKSCGLSRIGCTSFFPAKPLGCYGDGGALFTNAGDLAARLRSLMNHGQGQRYIHRYVGINGRLDALQAAVLGVKLNHLDEEIARRQYLGERYTRLLASKDVVTPTILPDRTTVYAQYSIRVAERDSVIRRLNERGIPTAIHYPIPVYRQEAFLDLGVDPAEYPVTELVCREVMSLPMSAFLTEEEQDYIVENLINA
jgi:UDP-2-acetamido-2-deoxy-ribo-hexuluronate aminotransferase